MAEINTTLNDVFKTTAAGDRDRSIGSVFYGINHRKTPLAVPANTDDYGLIFFTRPQLNLTAHNLRNERRLHGLLTEEASSLQRIIRCYLDPRLQWPTGSAEHLDCPFVDMHSAFIPLLSNHCVSFTGMPDPIQDSFTSEPGVQKETYSLVDSVLEINGPFTANATFRNMLGDPITSLFRTWMIYQSAAFMGTMSPYPDFLAWNIVDYQTRVYRLVLDKRKRFVQKIACVGVAFPSAQNLGSAFDYNVDQPQNPSQENLSISLQCTGARYNDILIVHQFNKVVQIFNPYMRPANRAKNMVLLKQSELHMFNANYACYPLIDPLTFELQWYVKVSDYLNELAAYERHSSAMSI